MNHATGGRLFAGGRSGVAGNGRRTAGAAGRFAAFAADSGADDQSAERAGQEFMKFTTIELRRFHGDAPQKSQRFGLRISSMLLYRNGMGRRSG